MDPPAKKSDTPLVTPIAPKPATPTVADPTTLPSLILPSEPENRPTPKEADTDKTKKPIPPATPSPAPASGDPGQSSAPKSPGATLILPGTPAAPSPAPASPDSLIPPLAIPTNQVPGKPDSLALPALTLPPEVPVAPANKTESKSHSSPLQGSGKMTVEVFPVSALGKAVEGYRAVNFYNHTGRDITLTIEGKTVKLPAKSYIESKVGQKFNWGYGDRPAGSEFVPEGAAGLEVVFRE